MASAVLLVYRLIGSRAPTRHIHQNVFTHNTHTHKRKAMLMENNFRRTILSCLLIMMMMIVMGVCVWSARTPRTQMLRIRYPKPSQSFAKCAERNGRSRVSILWLANFSSFNWIPFGVVGGRNISVSRKWWQWQQKRRVAHCVPGPMALG